MAASAAKAILDTSVYLSFLRKNVKIIDIAFLLRPTLLYMSSVVFAELYAGAVVYTQNHKDFERIRAIRNFHLRGHDA